MYSGLADIVELLIQKGADIHTVNSNRDSILKLVIDSSKLNIVFIYEI